MQRVILGLLKGLIVGGGVGYALLKLGWTSAVWAYLACGVVGALVGIVAGRPPWKAETIWTPVVKLVVGGLIGVGLCALGRKVVPAFSLPTVQFLGPLDSHSGSVLALVIGGLYGLFVEVDDGGRGDKADAKAAEKRLQPPANRPKLKG